MFICGCFALTRVEMCGLRRDTVLFLTKPISPAFSVVTRVNGMDLRNGVRDTSPKFNSRGISNGYRVYHRYGEYGETNVARR